MGPDVNACSIVPDGAVDALNPAERPLVNTLLTGAMTFDGCSVGHVPSVRFGVRVIDEGPSLEEVVGAGTAQGAEALEDVGDEAFRAQTGAPGRADPVAVSIGARFGDREVVLRNDSLGSDDPDVVVSEEAALEFLRAYGEAVPDGFVEEATSTAVAGECPGSEEETVERLVGPVQLARGGRTAGSVQCAYLGEDLATLSLSRRGAQNADDLLQVDPLIEEELEIEGVVAAKISSTEGVDDAEIALQPSEAELAFARVVREGGPDRAALVALAEVFLRTSSP